MANTAQHINYEKRETPRKKCMFMPVDYAFRDGLKKGLITDISQSGAKIENLDPLPVGSHTTLTFMESTWMGPVKTRGIVIRSFDKGFAVEFDDLRSDYQSAIGKLVELAVHC